MADLDGDKPIRRAFEIGDTAEFRRVDKRALKIICPTVIRAAEVFGFAFRFGHYGGGVMTADVEEAPQNAILAPNN